jgi:hypothetical protein
MKKKENQNKIVGSLLLALGLVLLPFAYVIWVMDRVMFTLIPQSEHKKLNEWLNNKDVVFAFTRIATFTILFLLLKWVIGF